MNLYFANPWGGLALLSVLPLIYLHFFRRRTRAQIVNTLFLVDADTVNRAGGNLKERWRQTVSFWLQVLVLLLIAWLLTQPRWVNSQAVGRIAVVLDSSASMEAFRAEAADAVKRVGQRAESLLPQVEYSVLRSDRINALLYRGFDLAEALNVVENWRPRAGTHDATERLLDARTLVGTEGFVFFVSDRPVEETPLGVVQVTVGKPLENVGFARAVARGVESGPGWRTLVRNYGASPATREWWLEFEGGASQRRSVEIAAGKAVALEGVFPEGATQVALVLESDAFGLDDYVPIVLPRSKRLRVGIAVTDPNRVLIERVVASLEACELASGEAAADLQFRTVAAVDLGDLGTPGVYFLRAEGEAPRGVTTGIKVAANHDYNVGLSWDGLFFQGQSIVSLPEEAEALLWQGDAPLVFLVGEALVFNFEIQNSNLDRLPAFVLAIARHVESVRAAKPVSFRANVETGQQLGLVFRDDAKVFGYRSAGVALSESTGPANRLQAPDEAGFFRVVRGEAVLMEGAAQFSDVRESDFSDASEAFELEGFEGEMVETFYDDDFAPSFWLLSVAGILLASWWACYRENL